ncbi:TPA: hypothetical protein ACNGZL_004933, partial [Escherichia coli]
MWLHCGEVPRYCHRMHTQPPQCRHCLTNIPPPSFHHVTTLLPSSLTPCRHRLSTLFPPLPVASWGGSRNRGVLLWLFGIGIPRRLFLHSP